MRPLRKKGLQEKMKLSRSALDEWEQQKPDFPRRFYVYGVPSMRHLSTIPVFSPYPGTGYGFDDDSKKMLGRFTWGDAHHPALSETNGDYDGRWLFINDMNGRVARIDLRDFKTKQIFGPAPNISGNHGSSFVTPNTEYALMSSRFSIPIPKLSLIHI